MASSDDKQFEFMTDQPSIRTGLDHVVVMDALTVSMTTIAVLATVVGYGLIESGIVNTKNELNVLVKYVSILIFTVTFYWLIGHALATGSESPLANGFCGWGNFALNNDQKNYRQVLKQLMLLISMSAIISGMMAERTKLESFITIISLNVILYSVRAYWMWSKLGWLCAMGVVDIGGVGPVHIVGGAYGLVATLILGSRYRRFLDVDEPVPLPQPKAVLGLLFTWIGWIFRNCVLTFEEYQPHQANIARVALATLISSIGGGITGFLYSYIRNKRQIDCVHLMNGILASLVSISGLCGVAYLWESFLIGCGGAILALLLNQLLECLTVDDPVGGIGVHLAGGFWSLVACGLFARGGHSNANTHVLQEGLIFHGQWALLGIQSLAAICCIVWGILWSLLTLFLIQVTVGVRLLPDQQFLGSDIVEHGIKGLVYNKATRHLQRNKKLSTASQVTQQRPVIMVDQNQGTYSDVSAYSTGCASLFRSSLPCFRMTCNPNTPGCVPNTNDGIVYLSVEDELHSELLAELERHHQWSSLSALLGRAISSQTQDTQQGNGQEAAEVQDEEVVVDMGPNEAPCSAAIAWRQSFYHRQDDHEQHNEQEGRQGVMDSYL